MTVTTSAARVYQSHRLRPGTAAHERFARRWNQRARIARRWKCVVASESSDREPDRATARGARHHREALRVSQVPPRKLGDARHFSDASSPMSERMLAKGGLAED